MAAQLAELGRPLLVGASRKRFLGELLAGPEVIGAPFYLMEYADGQVLRERAQLERWDGAAATALALVAAGASAADRSDLHREDMVRVKQSNAAIAKSGTVSMAHSRHAQALGLDADSRLFLLDRKTDRGVRNHRYQQTFRGLPIFGEHVIVNEDVNGNVSTLFGQKVDGLAAEIPAGRPRLSNSRALAIGKSAGLGNRVGFMRTTAEKSELMIHIDDNGRARKAYVVSFFADTARGGAPTRPTVIVDADSGRILQQFDNLQHALVGTGPGGNNKTGWGNARYDALVTASQTEGDPATRWQQLQEAERLLVEEECPIVCVYTYVAQGLLDERVRGFEPNLRDLHPLKYVWLEP